MKVEVNVIGVVMVGKVSVEVSDKVDPAHALAFAKMEALKQAQKNKVDMRMVFDVSFYATTPEDLKEFGCL